MCAYHNYSCVNRKNTTHNVVPYIAIVHDYVCIMCDISLRAKTNIQIVQVKCNIQISFTIITIEYQLYHARFSYSRLAICHHIKAYISFSTTLRTF